MTENDNVESAAPTNYDFFRGVAFTIIAAGAAGAVPADISGEPKHAATVALVAMFTLGLYEVTMSGEVQFLTRKIRRWVSDGY